MSDHCFISYSGADGLEFSSHLADELQGQHPFIKTWLDKRELSASSPEDWDDQIARAIKSCKCLVFVMTVDSTAEGSVCKDEWTWALKYKKPVITLRKDRTAEIPFRLNNHQHIDFSEDFDIGIAQLRTAIKRLDSPEGILDQLKRRLAAANRDLRRANNEDKPRIQGEIDELNKQIETQQKIVDNPKSAQEQTKKNIETGLERERKSIQPSAAKTSTKFINPPPGIAPNYFQDRLIETQQIVNFLKDDAQRLMTIVGRGGVGKTAMVCRLLKGLERGVLPDDIGEMKVGGVVYLSENGSHRVNFANIFYDLCKLLPNDTAQQLDTIYKNPQGSTESKMHALLEKFEGERVVLLLDNFEPLVATETFAIHDAELDEALHAFLKGTHTLVKMVITTRVAPRTLNLLQPGRQRALTLDEGLGSPYAENILREMDNDGHIGLKSASDDLLGRARERTRGYPRALEALFAILASDRYTKLEELLSMPMPDNVVEALVGEAFNRLDTSAQKVVQALAVYNRPVPPAAVDYLLAPHLPVMDSAPILQRLANMHFARKESGRFYLHPVDREFAYKLLPEGTPSDILRSSGGLELYNYFVNILDNYPDLLENEDTYHEATQYDDKDFIIDLVAAYKNLDPGLLEKIKDENNYEDQTLLAILDKSLQIPQVWTQYALTTCAADYFALARKPREELKKQEDITAQLAEFELRCVAEDWNLATSVLLEISAYLEQWGHYQLMIDLHRRVKENVSDTALYIGNLSGLGAALWRIGRTHESIAVFEEGLDISRETKFREQEGDFLGGLGLAYSDLGNKQKAIEFYEQALALARDYGNRESEEAWLGDLGNCYAELGDTQKALECHRLALAITRETGVRSGESNWLGNIGHDLRDANNLEQAIQSYEQSIHIGDEISYSITQNYERWGLAQVYLFQNDLVNARVTIEAALEYDVPQNNHNTTALHGIIVLRQGDVNVACLAFMRAIAQADQILTQTPAFYEALDAKGLALCGTALCARSDGRLTIERGRTIAEAVETFRKAREIAPHAGIVKRVLRLFDELVKCDEEGILKDVRKAIDGN